MLDQAKWICTPADYGMVCPVFQRDFQVSRPLKAASLKITALGSYIAKINQKRVGDFVLAPGWTSYDKRLQVQEYDVKQLLEKENKLEILAGMGWYHSGMSWAYKRPYRSDRIAVICELTLCFSDGTQERIVSDDTFQSARTQILQSTIYGGEIYDARPAERKWEQALVLDFPKDMLIPQEGEKIVETQRLAPVCVNRQDSGDYIIDFGQNLTGYVEFYSQAPEGTVIELRHGEILDHNGNVYLENLRTAQQRIYLISNSRRVYYKPHFSFQGFRYIQVIGWHGELTPSDFTAIVVHSDLKRTGHFRCSNSKINQLYQNIIWGQRGNFLDVPTDCPQRDERLGWTGDAQMFIKTATYNFQVERFFTKWLHDLRVEQYENGGVPAVIPDVLDESSSSSAAWGDAAVICPWQIYLSYGNTEILREQYESMKKWVLYIKSQGQDPYLWNTGHQFGDWLALDAEVGSYIGATETALIATAYFAYSTSLVIRSGKVLGEDVRAFESLYEQVKASFQNHFIKDGKLISQTQTAHVLTLFFDLAENPEEIAARLAEMIRQNGCRLQTGFVGTPYLLPALTKSGYAELAYSLLLQEEFPSWLFSVNQGATTIWEHWDGINADGKLWSSDMNSFNHYAYGAVGDWMYEYMAGIRIDEHNPGFKNIIFAPVTDERMDQVEASVETKYGLVTSAWECKDGKTCYRFQVPQDCTADIYIEGEHFKVAAGDHMYER